MLFRSPYAAVSQPIEIRSDHLLGMKTLNLGPQIIDRDKQYIGPRLIAAERGPEAKDDH